MIAAPQCVIQRRIELHLAIGPLHADDGRSLVGEQGLAQRLAFQPGFVVEVNLVPAEVEQFQVGD